MIQYAFDDATSETDGRVLTRRLLILMKKQLKLLNDIVEKLHVDPTHFLDPEPFGDFWRFEEIGIPNYKVVILDRKFNERNYFCILEGKNNSIIGIY